MAKHRKIIVRGQQRDDIDPLQLAKVLVSIAADRDRPRTPPSSPDVFDAAIEDRQAGPEDAA